MRINYLLFFITWFAFFACNTSSENKKLADSKIESSALDTAQPNEKDTIFIFDNPTTYPSDSIGIILSNLGICSIEANKPKTDFCNYKDYRFFKNSKSTFLTNFLIEVQPGIKDVYPRLLSIAKINGKYYITNDYKGQLYELRTQLKQPFDILVKYYDKTNKWFVDISHTWKNNEYVPVKVELINDAPLKDEYADTLNKFYITKFIWGT